MAALTTTAIMALTAASTATTAISQNRQAGAVRRAGDYEAKVNGVNADFAELQAEDALARGREAEVRQRSQTRQLVGSQRASLAAQGVDVDSGSALDVQADATRLGELDALTIRNNAAREAWGFKVDAFNSRAGGVLAKASARNQASALRSQAAGTLLTGAAQTYGIYKGAK